MISNSLCRGRTAEAVFDYRRCRKRDRSCRLQFNKIQVFSVEQAAAQMV